MAYAIAVAVLLTVSDGFDCPPAANTGVVGSCAMALVGSGECDADRGMAFCGGASHLYGCFCNAGYCRWPTSTLEGGVTERRRCVQRIPGGQCSLNPSFCSRDYGPNAFCEHMMCMCKFGYKLDPQAQADSLLCVIDDDPRFEGLVVPNSPNLELADIAERTTLRHEDSSVVVMGAALFSLEISFIMIVISLVLLYVRGTCCCSLAGSSSSREVPSKEPLLA